VSLASVSVRRPVTTYMAVLIVLILGIISFLEIPVELMPEITFPTVTINTEYENVNPQEVEVLVTEPIERAVSSVEGVERVSSVSVEGRSQVRVSFTWGTDLDAAVNDLRSKIDRIRDDLPRDAEPPVIFKYDVNASPVMFIGISGDMDSVSLRSFVRKHVQYRIERVPGVASAEIRGGLEREIHVNLFLDKMKALGLTPADIVRTLQADNVNLPGGHLDRAHLEVTVRTLGEFTNLDQIRNTVLTSRGGIPVYLKDVAEVKDSYKEIDHVVRLSGRNALVLIIRKQPGANIVDAADRIKKEIKRINQDYAQIEVHILRDHAQYIKGAISSVRRAALWGGTLAIIILLFFLRNVRSTFVIATAVPVSVIATFSLMYFQGFTVNIMTFGGLALGIGLLLDNSIVVLENIFRHREQGAERKEAVLRGTREVAGAITASTLTTLVVFLPLVFIPGTAGVLFKQLAWVVFFSLAASLLVALTLVPVMAHQLLGDPQSGHRSGFLGWLFVLGERFLSGLDEAYRALISWSLSHRGVVFTSAIALLAWSLTLFPSVGREFMPRADEGEVRIVAEMEEGAKIENVDEAFKKMEAIVNREVPETENLFTHFGRFGWRTRGKNKGHIHAWIGPGSKRQRSDKDIARSLRRELRAVPGIVIKVRARSGLFIFRRLHLTENDNLEVHLRGHDLEKGQILAQEIKTRMEQVDGIVGVRINRQGGQPEVVLNIDREGAANLGVPVSTLAQAVQTSIGGTRATLYREGGDEFNVLVRLAKKDRSALSGLLDLTVATASGRPVPLKSLVRLEERRAPMEIHRLDQERIITISGEVTGRDMGGAVRDLQASLREIQIPSDFAVLFGGDYQAQKEAFNELSWGLLLALVLVYMVMAAQFESFLDPLIIMFSVPFATIGVLLALVLTGTTLNVNSFIGIMMLAGIVVNNAIVLVDYINLKVREDALSIREAVIQGGRTRLRPILMTSLTTMLAMIPLAVGIGDGGEVQAPLARVVIGGLATSTLITLILIPVLYAAVKERKLAATWSWGFSRSRLANGRVFKKSEQ